MSATICHLEVFDNETFVLENISQHRLLFWIPNRDKFYSSYVREFLAPKEEITVVSRRKPSVDAKEPLEIRWIRVSDTETDLITPFIQGDYAVIKNLLDLMLTVIEATEPLHWGWVLGENRIVTSRRRISTIPNRIKKILRRGSMREGDAAIRCLRPNRSFSVVEMLHNK